MDIEDIIKKICEADEVEIMEFDFSYCFEALREYKKLREQAKVMVDQGYFKPTCITFENVLNKTKYT
jgi:predicted methyltransferase